MNRFLLILFIPGTLQAFTDESHFSATFREIRHFRVFTPPDYVAGGPDRKYPVIYFLHGCGGSYQKSGTYSYQEYGLVAPEAIGRTVHPDYEYPNNADFENFTLHNDVIIVCLDGKIEGLPGCGVYFPSMADNWTGNFYNFSVYIRELIEVVDSRYNTLSGPQYRAISGLSMGGHSAIWLAAANPHLFSSASQFCHAPNFYDVGEPGFATTIDVQQLWRNLRGLPFRNTTTDRDYIQYYTMQTNDIFTGAGFENEFYRAEYCVHMAARVDLQFGFHMKHFGQAIQEPECFSHMNLYPSFEIRGYEVNSSKSGNGWIYLHDVSRNGLGIYTRRRFPWGRSLPGFSIKVSTPAAYIPNEKYTISRYCYRSNAFREEMTTADKDGRIGFSSSGSMGEEIGILGPGLQPPVVVLTDTLNENLYLDDDLITPLSFEVINLSDSRRNVEFIASAGNSGSLEIIRASKRIGIPAFGKLRIDSMFMIRASSTSTGSRVAYLRIRSVIDGLIQEREQFIQVNIHNHRQYIDRERIKIFDGRSENLKVFKYDWGAWDDPLSSCLITEGSGNGNGIAERGEVFSIWIQPSLAFDPADRDTWHPTVAVNRNQNTDIQVEDVRQHNFSTGRSLISAQIRLNRTPTADNPVRIPLQTEFLKLQPLTNDCHRKFADNFDYALYEIVLGPNGIIDPGIEPEKTD